ncbi:MAG: helix-turn-helix domain-containing protein [Chloroflexota bacterium]
MLLERLFDNLELSLEAFAVCEVASGWRLRLDRIGQVTVHFVLAGQGRLRMSDGSVVAMPPHSLVLVPADRSHTIEIGEHIEHETHADDTGVRDGELVIFEVGPRGEDELTVICGRIQAHYGSGLGLFDRLDRALALDFSDSPEMASVFDRLMAEERHRSAASGAMMTNLMNEVLIHLFRRLCAEPDCPLPWLSALEDPRLSVALAQMLEHPERAHTLDSLADSALMSRSAFAEAFSLRFADSPMAYLRGVRMRRAASLLRGTDMSVEQVAARVGYASRSQFSRAFSSQFGVSPAAYRSTPAAT